MTQNMPQTRNEYQEEVVPFRAGDGLACNLIHIQDSQPPRKGPVLLVHGAGVRANIFRAPVETTIVDALLTAGYDVWLENWRASIDLPPNPWTLDEAALYDHPAAARTVSERTGYDRIKAVVHCQGSTSFMMSAVAGLLPQVTTIVSNAVALHPIIPAFSRCKIWYGIPAVALLTHYLNPQWGLHAPDLLARLLDAIVQTVHHECDNPVCKEVSFTYGTGFPALWLHENLTPETHDWLKQEFAHVPISFFQQMGKCVRAGHLLSLNYQEELLRNYVAQKPQTDARIAFFAGQQNRCFLPESQVRSFQFFDQYRRNYHALHVLPGYSHLDVFMSHHAARDIFPLMVEELDK